jgi:hypothetical protein
MLFWIFSCFRYGSDTGSNPSSQIFELQLDEHFDTYTILSSNGTTNNDGVITFSIDIESDVHSFLVQAHSPNQLISVEEIKNPNGQSVLHWQDWYDSKRILTEGFFAESPYVTINYPILDTQKLSKGTWEISFGVVNTNFTYQPNAHVSIQALTPTNQAKELHVQLLYNNNSISEDTLSTTLSYWKEIYSTTNINLQIQTKSQVLGDIVYPPHEQYKDISSESLDHEIVIVLTDIIENDSATLGVVGSIPGSSFPSPQSVLLISWLGIAGVDGVIDSESEKHLFAETFAHEVGHYLGLFHPVEDNYRSWDALEDTPECNQQSTCEQQLQHNVMFPYPICDIDECIKQDELTSDQIHTMRNYAPL